MRKVVIRVVTAALIFSGLFVSNAIAEGYAVYPTAIFAFKEKGSSLKGYGEKVSNVLFATLSTKDDIYLVDREDMKKILDETSLNLTGMVNQQQMIQIGHLTGAKILITGSIMEIDGTLMVVAKIIGTETSRVFGETVRGKTNDDLFKLIENLSNKVALAITTKSGALVAKKITRKDRLASLKTSLPAGKKPSVVVDIEERHTSRNTIDPAAETEMELFLMEMGFVVIESGTDEANRADLRIKGEGFSEFAMRHGEIISVKARLEIKAINNATNEIVAVDRQIEVEVDLTEQIAGKKALQRASAQIAERLIPKLIGVTGH